MPIEFINIHFFATLMPLIDSQHKKVPKTVVCRILHRPCDDPGWANVPPLIFYFFALLYVKYCDEAYRDRR